MQQRAWASFVFIPLLLKDCEFLYALVLILTRDGEDYFRLEVTRDFGDFNLTFDGTQFTAIFCFPSIQLLTRSVTFPWHVRL